VARIGGERAFLLAALLPALLLAPVFGGRAAWIHSHGGIEGHVHILPVSSSAGELGFLGAWHASQHEGEVDSHEDDHERVPSGIVVGFPRILAVCVQGASSASQSVAPHLADAAAYGWRLDAIESPYRPELCRSRWPPGQGRRSGIAALLRSSHAILI
jgi:hypothetical protein